MLKKKLFGLLFFMFLNVFSMDKGLYKTPVVFEIKAEQPLPVYCDATKQLLSFLGEKKSFTQSTNQSALPKFVVSKLIYAINFPEAPLLENSLSKGASLDPIVLDKLDRELSQLRESYAISQARSMYKNKTPLGFHKHLKIKSVDKRILALKKYAKNLRSSIGRLKVLIENNRGLYAKTEKIWIKRKKHHILRNKLKTVLHNQEEKLSKLRAEQIFLEHQIQENEKFAKKEMISEIKKQKNNGTEKLKENQANLDVAKKLHQVKREENKALKSLTFNDLLQEYILNEKVKIAENECKSDNIEKQNVVFDIPETSKRFLEENGFDINNISSLTNATESQVLNHKVFIYFVNESQLFHEFLDNAENANITPFVNRFDDCIKAGLACNKQGDTQKASQYSDLCFNISTYIKETGSFTKEMGKIYYAAKGAFEEVKHQARKWVLEQGGDLLEKAGMKSFGQALKNLGTTLSASKKVNNQTINHVKQICFENCLDWITDILAHPCKHTKAAILIAPEGVKAAGEFSVNVAKLAGRITDAACTAYNASRGDIGAIKQIVDNSLQAYNFLEEKVPQVTAQLEKLTLDYIDFCKLAIENPEETQKIIYQQQANADALLDSVNDMLEKTDKVKFTETATKFGVECATFHYGCRYGLKLIGYMGEWTYQGLSNTTNRLIKTFETTKMPKSVATTPEGLTVAMNEAQEALKGTRTSAKNIKIAENIVKPLGRKNTGRFIPNTIEEQIAMKQVMTNPYPGPGKGKIILKPIKDKTWPEIGWKKMQYTVEYSYFEGKKVTINIHYLYNDILNVFDDFKFKSFIIK